MKRYIPIFLIIFLFLNSCRKRSEICDEPVLNSEEKAWMAPYSTSGSFKYYFTNQFGLKDSVYSVELSYKYVHFSTDDRCGTGMNAACDGVTFNGGAKFKFSASGYLYMYVPTTGNYKYFKLNDQPINAGMFETTVDTAGQASNFVYKIYYSKTQGIKKFITKNGQVFQRY